MGWLAQRREVKARELARIQAIRDAYAAAKIIIDDEVNKKRLHTNEIAAIDFESLQSLLRYNILKPGTHFKRGAVSIDFGITSSGSYVYALCWVAEFIDKPDPDSAVLYEINKSLPLFLEFLTREFNGQIDIRCSAATVDDLPTAIAKVNSLVNKVVEFVGE